MHLRWPQFTCHVRGGFIMCHGIVQPLPITNAYRVRIEYQAGTCPKVFIEEPPLRQRGLDTKIPHTYRQERPCIYCSNEWRSDKTIATTIVPWLMEWLVFYEGWFATGEWHGKGAHPFVTTPDDLREKEEEPLEERSNE